MFIAERLISFWKRQIAMARLSKQSTVRAPVVAALLGFLLLTAKSVCAQVAVLRLPTEDQQMIEAQLGAGVVGRALPSTPIEDTSVYFPLHEKAPIYQVTAGPNAGNTQTLSLGEIRHPSGESVWRFQFSPWLIGFIRRTAEGDLIMPSVGDTSERVVAMMAPANPFMVKGMKPGETRSYVQHVRVNGLDDPYDREYSGSLKGTYTYLGTYRVTVPAGTYSSVLFRIKCEGQVGPAHTRDMAYYFFAPGKGVVAMISQENATAFWFIHIDTVSGEVLASD
jgi:hypothetical protein